MNIVVLAGGISPEREISFRSGRFVEAGLREGGHTVRVVDPAETPLESVNWVSIDCCFPALHGGSGEDGRVQRWLEAHQIPFVGSGSVASRLAMHKASAKACFRHSGIPTPDSFLLGGVPCHSTIRRLAALHRGPWVVKPECQGSSIGVQLARKPDKLNYATKNSLRYSQYAIVEKAVWGRELTVTVMNRTPLPILEIAHGSSVFDTYSKYADPRTTVRFATDLQPIDEDTVKKAAVGAAKALNTSGLVRVDLILDASGTPWVLEVNTIPGLSAASLAPKAAAAAGFDRAGLCNWMLESSYGRFGNERRAKVARRRVA